MSYLGVFIGEYDPGLGELLLTAFLVFLIGGDHDH
jgi:hypothetical protein